MAASSISAAETVMPEPALAYVQFHGTHLYMKLLADEILQNFSAASQHFMAEGIDLGFVGVFADKGSAGVGDSLGHTDNYVWIFS